ncbi:alpha-glucosidase [Burkholderia sp. Ac-20353]|uniref:alpha-glucosidase n=1 Tax=Burkholderia sp. Ac-20353 TaxID=2703894 RepID=UPI00197C39BA|nr:alpha-glucosidase [Burkholderia sp. Ac-20353]MBN3785720.1 alpha-glucosidase [Burkholderia sp. Ac-20353]
MKQGIVALDAPSQEARDWWRGSVVYQIYPRSFADSNGDGIGDLKGITGKLDYVARLGVDAIWISPFFRSPMKDFGYDVSDYRDVDPIFGTLDDFDALVSRAHALGIKVLIDQVLSHTSDQHPWFLASRADRTNAKADWYVWADAQADGTPPNNWLSVFGGPAWQWDTRRRQYYLHNFLSSQPDLNLHRPDVRRQILDEVRFWLDRGVDGCRLDATNFYLHDPGLRNNPALDGGAQRAHGTPSVNPYDRQRHLYDKNRPENIEFLKELRTLADRYPGVVLLGEIGHAEPLSLMAEYTKGRDRLHETYSFGLLTDEFSVAAIRRTLETLEGCIGDGWPCWSTGNHDVPRVATRWGGAHAPKAFTKLIMALLLSLRGSVCVYQGEELGLAEADIAFEDLQDPSGIAFWPEGRGRDGCRTPIPWNSLAEHAGFSTHRPWLPLANAHRADAVDVQDADADSALNACRRFIAWRRTHPALSRGAIRFVETPGDSIGFVREYGDDAILAIFNLSGETIVVTPPDIARFEPLDGHGFQGQRRVDGIELPPYGAFFARC